MKNLMKLLLVATLVTCWGCGSSGGSTGASEPETTPETQSQGSVKFSMEVVEKAIANLLANSTASSSIDKVALAYNPVGGTTVNETIDLNAFGDSYVTNDAITLSAGDYQLTKFDVLNDSGVTIYSTPSAGSDIAISTGITTPLVHSFTVSGGATNTVKMQVAKVDDGDSPEDFGHTAFTFDMVGYNIFFIDVLAYDSTVSVVDSVWQYTTANLIVKNVGGETIKDTALAAQMNRIIVASSTDYTLTVENGGFAPQVFNMTEDSLKMYNTEPFVVKFK